MDGRRRYAWCGSSKKSLKCRQSGGQGGYDHGIDDPKTVFDSFNRWATAYLVKPISNEMVRELRAWTDSVALVGEENWPMPRISAIRSYNGAVSDSYHTDSATTAGSTEDQFLELGGKLQDFAIRSSKIIVVSSELVELVAGLKAAR